MQYTWRPAHGGDVKPIVNMAETYFQNEIDTIFKPEPVIYSRNITLAIINQFYGPTTNLVQVCYDEHDNLLAYLWCENNHRAAWSDDVMIMVRMVHLNMNLSPRIRVQLVGDMINHWEDWARECGTPIVCSTTMRGDQDGFLKLHARRGYDVRGSYAYKRLS